MSYVDQQGLTPAKITALVISLGIVGGIGLLMILGLAVSAVQEVIERVETFDLEEPPPPEEEPEPPPEQPQEVAPPPPVAPPPLVIPPPAPVAAPAPPPPPPSQARGATTRNQRRWASRIQENYPSRALREEVEGTVQVRVTVTPNGRAANCQVTGSSGSSVLDQAACRGMERYARFNPALDDAGNPTTGSYSTGITYRLN